MPENGQINMGKSYILQIYAREQSNKQGGKPTFYMPEKGQKKTAITIFLNAWERPNKQGKTFNFIK